MVQRKTIQEILQDDPNALTAPALPAAPNPIIEEELEPQYPSQLKAQPQQEVQPVQDITTNERNNAGLLDDLATQSKIAEIGMAGAAQAHDRKYDNPASQKIYDQLIAQRGVDLKNKESAYDRARKMSREDARDPLELQQLKAQADTATSNSRVAQATEGDKITQAGQQTRQGALNNQQLEQNISFASQEQPQRFAMLKYQAQQARNTAQKSGRDLQKINPTLAAQVASTLNMSPESAQNLTYADLDDAIKLGTTGAKINKDGSAGQDALDKAYNKDYLEWTSQGAPNAERNLSSLDQIGKDISSAQGENFITRPSGPENKFIPDIFQSERGTNLKEGVRQSVMNTLRATLGGQFAEKEGERIFNLAYNDNVSPQENLKRVNALTQQLRAVAANNQSKADFYKQKGTLRGWEAPNKFDLYGTSESGTTTPAGPKDGDSKIIGGKTYVRQNGKWFEQK